MYHEDALFTLQVPFFVKDSWFLDSLVVKLSLLVEFSF